MTKEKLSSLIAYVENMKSKLADKNVPEKHKNGEESYRNFLRNEIRYHTLKIEAAKMAGVAVK